MILRVDRVDADASLMSTTRSSKEGEVPFDHEPDHAPAEGDSDDVSGSGVPGAADDAPDGSELAPRLGSADGSAAARLAADSTDDPDPGQEESSTDESTPDALELSPREELVLAVAEERLVTLVQAAALTTSGPIPAAGDLYEYLPEHQERILAMAEAPTTAESARRDRVVDARIDQSARAQWITPVMLFVCIGSALLCFGVFKSTAGGLAFLALPAFKFLGSYAVTFSLGGRRKRE